MRDEARLRGAGGAAAAEEEEEEKEETAAEGGGEVVPEGEEGEKDCVRVRDEART